MKSIIKTLTFTLLVSVTISSCSNSKVTTSTAKTTSTSSKTVYDVNAKNSTAKKAVAVKIDPRKVKAISATTRREISATKAKQNKVVK